MTDSLEALGERLQKRFTDFTVRCAVALGELTVEVPAANLFEVCQVLRDEADFAFEELMDLCGVDYSAYGAGEWETSEAVSGTGFSRGVEQKAGSAGTWQGPRFAVVLHLLSLKNNRRIRLKAFAESDPPRVPSVVEIWSSANWFEREAFDLFGILFDGHPDLRRILTDYGFVGHPFRKDFPLSGHVEMRYDAEKQRVVYQPVSIEPRVLVPRVLREDHRYGQGTGAGESDDA